MAFLASRDHPALTRYGMTNEWRLVDFGTVSPVELAGFRAVVSAHVVRTTESVAVTSVNGQTHVNVGWFDDVDSTLDLIACDRLGIDVVRRPLFGGGTAYYEADTVAMCSFLLDKEMHPDLDAELLRLQPVILDALDRIGLNEVRFEGASDLRWRDRKLGALIAQGTGSVNSVGGFVNLRRVDISRYLQVVRIPDEKFKDKLVKDLRDYIVPASEIVGHPVPYEIFRSALVDAMRSSGMHLSPLPLDDDELRAGVKSVEHMYSDVFVRRVSSERFRRDAPAGARVGFGNRKGRKPCRAGVALDARDVIVGAMMAGDMHVSPADVLDRIAAALVGADAHDSSDLRSRIASVFEAPDVTQADDLVGIRTDDLLGAVTKAIADAS